MLPEMVRHVRGPKKQLNVALSDSVRAQLEAASKEAGHSIAEEVRQRLERSFFGDGPVDQKTRDLAAAVSRFARLLEHDRGLPWHADPTTHAALGELISIWLQDHPPTRRMTSQVFRSAKKGSSPQTRAAASDLGLLSQKEGDPKGIAARLYPVDKFMQQELAKARISPEDEGDKS
jgi:hypothetical protein